MVAAMREMLVGAGVDEDDIRTEELPATEIVHDVEVINMLMNRPKILVDGVRS
jgi:hypothetical protein